MYRNPVTSQYILDFKKCPIEEWRTSSGVVVFLWLLVQKEVDDSPLVASEWPLIRCLHHGFVTTRGSIKQPHSSSRDGDRFNSCQVIYSQFGLAIHQNDHQARRRFVEWAQNEIAVVPDFHKRILFSDEAHFWLNGYVNKQNCRIWSEANPQVNVETPLHPEKLTVWCALWAGEPLLQKR
ncbi:hypothetical protein TNCV_5012911 [Trichonephila clavipes]|nr:hypothetical protein TNCV_5012911 [Trichonephila clavipes]